eukprot:1148647-Amphidinium_carterae.1
MAVWNKRKGPDTNRELSSPPKRHKTEQETHSHFLSADDRNPSTPVNDRGHEQPEDGPLVDHQSPS